jgi:hypothetical protein
VNGGYASALTRSCHTISAPNRRGVESVRTGRSSVMFSLTEMHDGWSVRALWQREEHYFADVFGEIRIAVGVAG